MYVHVFGEKCSMSQTYIERAKESARKEDDDQENKWRETSGMSGQRN